MKFLFWSNNKVNENKEEKMTEMFEVPRDALFFCKNMTEEQQLHNMKKLKAIVDEGKKRDKFKVLGFSKEV